MATRIRPSRWLVSFGVAGSFAVLPVVPRAEGDGVKAPTPNRAPQQLSAVAELEPVLDRALAAYNADDKLAFLAEFASTAPGIRVEGAYRRLFGVVYKGEFGKFLKKRLRWKLSVPDRDWGALTYDAAFEKHSKGRVVANFIRENGEVKLMQIRFDSSEW